MALALLWGALAATPFALRARGVSGRARVGAFGAHPPAWHQGGRHRRARPVLPAPLRRVVGRVRAHRSARREEATLARELPLVLDLLQVGVTAGTTPYAALELAIRWGPPAASSRLRGALDTTRLGRSLGEALDALARDAPVFAPVAAILGASDRLGAPASVPLARLADDARADLRRRAETRARTLPVKLLFPLVFLVLPAFGLLTVVPALLSALART